MKNLKKILAAVLALCLLLCFAGCGANEDNTLTMGTNAAFPPYEYVDDDGNIEQFADTCDRLIRVNKYYDIDNYEDYNTTTEMLQNITLGKRDRDILNKRLQGVSVSDIADIYGVSQQAISKALARIQKATADKYPEKIRQFKEKRIYK